MKVFDTVTGTEVPFEAIAATVAEANVSRGFVWGGDAVIMDLGEERDLHGLVFYDDENGPVKALFLLDEPPPTVFWKDFSGAHPDDKARPTKDFAVSVAPTVPPVTYRPYSRTCPPPPAPPRFDTGGASSAGGNSSDACTLVKVAEWVGAHGVAVTTTTAVSSADDPPNPPGAGAPDDPPWHLRSSYVDCL